MNDPHYRFYQLHGKAVKMWAGLRQLVKPYLDNKVTCGLMPHVTG